MNEKQQILMSLMEELFESIDQIHQNQCGEIRKECDHGNEKDDLHKSMYHLLRLCDYLEKQYLDSVISNHAQQCPDRQH